MAQSMTNANAAPGGLTLASLLQQLQSAGMPGGGAQAPPAGASVGGGSAPVSYSSSVWGGVGGMAPVSSTAPVGSGVPSTATSTTAIPTAPYQNFLGQGNQAESWANSAIGSMTGATNAADAAMSAFSGYNPTQNLSAYTPGALNSYSPGALQSWLAGLNLGPLTFGAAPTATAAQAGTDTSNLANFDPTQAATTYGQGAATAFNLALKPQLTDLANKEAASGRINTGMYDYDTGQIMQTLGQQYNADIAQQATALSGQKLSAMTSADQIQAQIAAQNAALATNVSEANASNVLGQEAAQTGAYNATTGRYGLAESGAQAIDTLGLTRANDLSQLGLTQATSMDQLGLQKQGMSIADLLQEQGLATQAATGAENAASNFASANLQYTTQEQMMQTLINYLSKMGMAPYTSGSTGGVGGSGAASTDPYALYRQQAQALGVPFNGPGVGSVG